MISFLYQWFHFLFLLYVSCRHRHVSDGLVSLHAFFPVVPTKLLHCDTADSPGIQTVRSNACRNKQESQCVQRCNTFTARDSHVQKVESHTVSIRVGTRRVETLNPTCLTERVFRNVSVKSVCDQMI